MNYLVEEALDSVIPVAQPSADASPYDVDCVVVVVVAAAAAVFFAVHCVGFDFSGSFVYC